MYFQLYDYLCSQTTYRHNNFKIQMNPITEKEGITDARKLGLPKYAILGVQHLFAMFGATVLVPVLTAP